jgi:hypothetical protein
VTSGLVDLILITEDDHLGRSAWQMTSSQGSHEIRSCASAGYCDIAVTFQFAYFSQCFLQACCLVLLYGESLERLPTHLLEALLSSFCKCVMCRISKLPIFTARGSSAASISTETVQPGRLSASELANSQGVCMVGNQGSTHYSMG